ncbi:MAG: hypothetical protein BWY95_02562 [Bacteroidetes bacterium ADurb.BinA104]|nr:MAG: hypothetical protein BWY95_02562 [Bacteroidetes bacterium ADurb.BinA104]
MDRNATRNNSKRNNGLLGESKNNDFGRISA